MDTATILTKITALKATADASVALIKELQAGPDQTNLQTISDGVDAIQAELAAASATAPAP